MARRRMQSKRPLGARVEVVSGRTLFTLAGGAATTIAVSPASFSRCLAIADVFQFYRFTDLKLVIIPNDAAVTAGFAPGAAFDTPPATAGTILELPLAVSHGFVKSVDTVLHVPRSELLRDTQIQWYKTIAGTPAVQFETQGNFYVVAPGAAGSTHYIEWTCEFQSWNLAAQSPLFLKPSIPAEERSKDIVSVSKIADDDLKSGSSARTTVTETSIVINGVSYKKSGA